MFQPLPSQVKFPQLEEEVLAFWRARKIYDRSLEQRQGAPLFVFYEGPPTANGKPHPGHCLTRAIKDLFPRFHTMRGKLCKRKAGWDTHGLPVEVEVGKELGIHSKEDIERYGVEPFIHRCVESVFRYTREWEQLTERLGFWIHLDSAYVTYHQSYIESVWWGLATLFNRGLLYQGHKIVWWWAQGGTALASGEVSQGYKEVADPSVFVRFPLLDESGRVSQDNLVVWTTTPWTLPSNQFAAVHPEVTYVRVLDAETGRKLILAEALLESFSAKVKKEFAIEAKISGVGLVGKRYQPPFDYYYAKHGREQGALIGGGREYLAWRVSPADFVSTDTGSGIVHQAPAFGEDDFELLQREQGRFETGEGPLLICAVGPDGKFTEECPGYQGRWVKEADKDIVRELRQRDLLLHHEQYLHNYPFCWRADKDPLIQYPRKSWFIRTTKFREQMLANNSKINWQPEHIRDGRFGNFLEGNVDWALSRERYWGTPLPIWVCDKTGKMEAVTSYAELQSKPGAAGFDVWDKAKAEKPELTEHLKIHKPYIDAVTYQSPFDAAGVMRRVPEVIDCWFDSGAMPFAQWGYPHQGEEDFQQQFPADFISEAIDQTRGWFYSQLAISTMLFGPQPNEESGSARVSESPPLSGSVPLPWPHPFRNCVVLGLMLGEDGRKMSKSLRNYREPREIFDAYGADALRWYFYANQPPWSEIRYNTQAIKDSMPDFLIRLWNCYGFFVIYANIDGFDPASWTASSSDGSVHAKSLDSSALAQGKHYRPLQQRGELDRWIMAELHHTLTVVIDRMEAYDNYAACTAISEFVDALSNWFVRRSRDRFWSSEKNAEKWDAYWTLYECLLATCKIIAPFTPFIAETIWRNLAAQPFSDRAAESVHLCDYPQPDASAINHELAERMKLVREIVSLGRSARAGAKLKVRQPLSRVEIVLPDRSAQDWLAEHAPLIMDELNVKKVEFAADAKLYVDFQILPDLKALGPKLGKRLPAVKQWLAAAKPEDLVDALAKGGKVQCELDGDSIELNKDEVQVRLQAKPGWAAAQGAGCVIVLATELDDALIAEGYARELVHAVQSKRKELDCDYTDRIQLGLVASDEQLLSALLEHAAYIQGETLATEIVTKGIDNVEGEELKLGDAGVTLFVRNIGKPGSSTS